MTLDGTLDVTPTAAAVEFVFAITNPDPNKVELQFRNGLVVDFAVFAGEEEVWRYSDGRMFSQQLEREQLAPGESLVVSAAWREPEPGEYRVETSLQATNQDLARDATFSV